MRRSWAAITVGVLVMVGLFAAFAIFKYTKEGVARGEGYTVFGRFRDAQGLAQKSRVQTAGLPVGQIETRELDENAKAKITIRLEPWFKIYENALVAKKSASLLGEFYLEIDPGTAFGIRDGQKVAMRQLKEGDEILRVTEPTAVGDIIDQVGTTLPILKDILRDVQAMTSGSIKDIAENTSKLIEKNSIVLERVLLRVDDIAANIQGIARAETEDIKISLRNVREITEGIKGLVGTSEGQVNATGNEIRSSVQKLQRSVDSLEKSLKNVEKVTGHIADGDGTVGRLVNNDTVARNLEDITDDASTLVRGISRLQTIVGLRTEYNYLANTFKSYFLIQLMPRPDKFYLIEIVDDPRGYREATTTVSHSSDKGFVSETQIKTSEKLRISFQFGKCLGVLCGRFGIKESTGGLGLDLHMLDDRLVLSTDVFDTRSNQYPRVQGRLAVAVYKKNLMLMAGVDDVLNYTRAKGLGGQFFDWFMGAQLKFNDEDLKSFLLFGGGAAVGAAGK